MIDQRERYERAFGRFEPPPDALERFTTYRDRRGKRRRITAGVVGIAMFVAVIVLIATSGREAPEPTPGGGGPSGSTGPTVAAPDHRVGFVGLPPEAATPSLPEVGEVVLQASARHTVCGSDNGMFCFVWVYADGRLIWMADAHLPYGANRHTTGLLEQRLTPTGVELLVSELTSTGGCSSLSDPGPIVCSGAALEWFPATSKPVGADPSWGLPARAWEDPEVRAFVPSRFRVCFLQERTVSHDSPATWQDLEPAEVLAWIPSSAADLLRGKDVELRWQEVPLPCFELTTEETRELSERLDAAGIERYLGVAGGWPYGLGYQLVGPERFPEPAILIWPSVPSGEWIFAGFS